MMEELNDEQPEIVTHEEAALAEKEATQGPNFLNTHTTCKHLH